jgi:hypothetical protein
VGDLFVEELLLEEVGVIRVGAVGGQDVACNVEHIHESEEAPRTRVDDGGRQEVVPCQKAHGRPYREVALDRHQMLVARFFGLGGPRPGGDAVVDEVAHSGAARELRPLRPFNRGRHLCRPGLLGSGAVVLLGLMATHLSCGLVCLLARSLLVVVVVSMVVMVMVFGHVCVVRLCRLV